MEIDYTLIEMNITEPIDIFTPSFNTGERLFLKYTDNTIIEIIDNGIKFTYDDVVIVMIYQRSYRDHDKMEYRFYSPMEYNRKKKYPKYVWCPITTYTTDKSFYDIDDINIIELRKYLLSQISKNPDEFTFDDGCMCVIL